MRLLPLFLFLPLVGCGDSPRQTGGTQSPEATSGAPIDQRVRDLVSTLTPPAATADGAERSSWFQRRRTMLDELNQAGPDLGQAVLDEYHAHPEAPLDVRRGLLEVAAHNLPEEVRDELAMLVTQYGDDLGLRTKACELLAQTSPKEAFELLEPLILEHRPGKTLPPEEIMVSSYATAARLAKLDPVETLSTLAADIFAEQTARLMALKELAKHPGIRSRETLRTVLVESTGNAYLRRGAAQALASHAKVDDDTAAQFCAILDEVMNKESDLNFQTFLVSMIEKYCQ